MKVHVTEILQMWPDHYLGGRLLENPICASLSSVEESAGLIVTSTLEWKLLLMLSNQVVKDHAI